MIDSPKLKPQHPSPSEGGGWGGGEKGGFIDGGKILGREQMVGEPV
jgi:hypothetical protein